MRTFVDTNVLVYAVDRGDVTKQARAIETLAMIEEVVFSAQVLAEFSSVVMRKLTPPLSADETLRHLRDLSLNRVESNDASLVSEAVGLAQRAKLSIWDALLLRAAVRAGCETLVTEDLTAGQVIDGVSIVNPFDPKAAPREA